jgi:hypothetical protein
MYVCMSELISTISSSLSASTCANPRINIVLVHSPPIAWREERMNVTHDDWLYGRCVGPQTQLSVRVAAKGKHPSLRASRESQSPIAHAEITTHTNLSCQREATEEARLDLDNVLVFCITRVSSSSRGHAASEMVPSELTNAGDRHFCTLWFRPILPWALVPIP